MVAGSSLVLQPHEYTGSYVPRPTPSMKASLSYTASTPALPLSVKKAQQVPYVAGGSVSVPYGTRMSMMTASMKAPPGHYTVLGNLPETKLYRMTPLQKPRRLGRAIVPDSLVPEDVRAERLRRGMSPPARQHAGRAVFASFRCASPVCQRGEAHIQRAPCCE